MDLFFFKSELSKLTKEKAQSTLRKKMEYQRFEIKEKGSQPHPLISI
jgi:hypothetical protein